MGNSVINVLLQGNNTQRILDGLLVTLKVSMIAIIISVLLGLLFGIVLTTKNKFVQLISKIYIQLINIIPIVVYLFIFYFEFTKVLNLNLSAEIVAIIVFSLWGIAEIGVIVKGAITSLSKGQIESAMALGLDTTQLYRYVVVPQAIRRMLPAAINLSTRMIKTTSLIVLIGVVDVLKVGQQIIETNIIKN